MKEPKVTLQQLTHHLNYSVESADKALAKFAAELARDPAYAFSWASEAMTAAARRDVARYLLAALEAHPEEVTVDVVRREAYAQVMRAARWPASSTSPVSNDMAARLTTAWAELLEFLGLED